jgi:hypothetical protein
MSKATTADVVGTARDRGDDRLKVMGAATYPINVTLPGLASAALVQSTVTSGRIRHIAVDAAKRHLEFWPSSRTSTRRRNRRGVDVRHCPV